MNTMKHLLTLTGVACAAGLAGPAYAGSVLSSSFNGVTDGSIATTGLADWGYINSNQGFFDSDLGGVGASYNNTPYGSLTNNGGTVISTVSGGSSIGQVTLTEGTSGSDTVGAQSNTTAYTFDGNAAFGTYGNFAPSEADIWQVTFNDLGVGTAVVSLYMGHTENNRVFDVDYSLHDGDDVASGTTVSPQIGTFASSVAGVNGNGSAFTYDIEVTTTNADADLTLTFGGVSGGFGGAAFAGYTVESTVIPSPTAALAGLIGLGGLCLRRRR